MNNECDNDDSVCEKAKKTIHEWHIKQSICMHVQTEYTYMKKCGNDESDNDEQRWINVANIIIQNPKIILVFQFF